MKQNIYEHFDLRVERKQRVRQFDAFWANRVLYIMVPVGHLEEEEIDELQKISDYMIRTHQDIYVSSFVKNKSDSYITDIEGKKIALFRMPYNNNSHQLFVGKELATFHYHARSFPSKVTAINRIGQWKDLWVKRIDQMESFYREKVRSNPVDVFDTQFVESFPYYLGLTENAIQYLVDTELDDSPMINDAATLCHHRFTDLTWQQNQWMKLPTDWIFDHASRDLSEWIRAECRKGSDMNPGKIQTFLQDYEKVSPLSSFSWRLLYARLVFPVHYLECVEDYYTSGPVADKKWHEDRMRGVLRSSSYYEQLLGNFYDLAGVPAKTYGIPILDWVKK
ncbi:spore coat protein YutH [Sutcliffiella horikoshii]|uniref:spore coat putative kinase YutH n=1 Tax=Sutcliffiella horikoshii TaxID=79883 RepID=UPI0007D06570|nr:spore coat protein YutH [Sutcliffiella horikoshii]MCM3618964.1 spore coat protein YutH [Sutcliffiella horikoshii]